VIACDGAIAATHVMFVGVSQLRDFSYPGIRELAKRALTDLKRTSFDVKSVAFTIHGPGYGLDENEAFESEFAGILDAVESMAFPDSLEVISFVEVNRARANRLQARLSALLPQGTIEIDSWDARHQPSAADGYSDSWRSAGVDSASKPHVFVAMPFAPEMDDTFHYGIQGASNSAGYLCERADLSSFTGDVMDWVKTRIATAALLIADLSSASPNVYLEVGYAWGCKVPTVLLARDAAELRFDVRGQRCIVYKSIKMLEEKLSIELSRLRRQGGTGQF
jgi:hypothetical protein